MRGGFIGGAISLVRRGRAAKVAAERHGQHHHVAAPEFLRERLPSGGAGAIDAGGERDDGALAGNIAEPIE